MSSSSDESVEEYAEYARLYHIPYESIELATNNFAVENLLKQGASFKVYKGHLYQSKKLVNIVARRSTQTNLIINEMIYSYILKPKYVVSLFKIADIEDEGIIINLHEANGSLDKHLSEPTFTWKLRLQICVGVAQALKYLHCDAQDGYNVIHGNIKCSKVLLDENWEPKLHGFGFAVKAKSHQLHLTSKYNGTLQYMDPAYENTGGVTHKSDIFSFGVMLFEVLFGREAFIQNNYNWYFTRLAITHYEQGKLDDLIHPDIRKQMNLQSLNMFAKTAYSCVKEERSQRPDINQVLLKLEKALQLQHEHEHSVTPAAVEVKFASSHSKLKSLDHLKFRLSDIELATNKFSQSYCIGSGGYGMVYKAELDPLDGANSQMERKNKSKLDKKNNVVAIKRISSREDEQGEQGFLAEIELLSKCKHPNIVSLQGFCNDGAEMILVYEYVSNGSLADYLENVENTTTLTWAQRIQICLDIANGLDYLHTRSDNKQSIIHRDIKSANILLDDEWKAKIADFGLSKLHPANQQGSTIITNNIAGTDVYLDPEYQSTGKLKTKSDVYSFGVVLFEIMCGKLAYDKSYNPKGLPSIARQYFNEGTLKNLVDPKMMEADEKISMLIGRLNQDSLDTFTKVAYRCLAETQSKRPTMKVVIKELVTALNFQKNSIANLYIPLKAIKLGTRNFSDRNCIREGWCWKLYEGEIENANGFTRVFAKRWDSKFPQGYHQFLTELETLLKYNHENIIGLVGYCNEMNEKIIVYKHASYGTLDKHLDDPSLTWIKRLKICICVAQGLEFLHSGGVGQEEHEVIHRDIKSSSILLDGDCNAKISSFELSCKADVYGRAEHLDDDDCCNSLGYIDPMYERAGLLTKASDVYSLGVILVEMLCGRLAWAEDCEDHSQSLGPLAIRHYYKKGNLDGMIFKGIKKQIAPKSLTTFLDISLECLDDGWNDRADLDDVVIELKRALELQEDYEIWEPKLPKDYKEIIHRSKYPENYKVEMKKGLHDMFSKGILMKDDKVLFLLGSNGGRNEIISATNFLYKNLTSHKWRSVPESRLVFFYCFFELACFCYELYMNWLVFCTIVPTLLHTRVLFFLPQNK